MLMLRLRLVGDKPSFHIEGEEEDHVLDNVNEPATIVPRAGELETPWTYL